MRFDFQFATFCIFDFKFGNSAKNPTWNWILRSGFGHLGPKLGNDTLEFLNQKHVQIDQGLDVLNFPQENQGKKY